MPPKETDGDWLTGGIGKLYIGTPDGGYVPYGGFPVIEEGYTIVTDEEVKRYNFNPSDFTDMTFTATVDIRFTRRLLKLLYTGRELRRQIRKQEKERRRRLKDGQHGS